MSSTSQTGYNILNKEDFRGIILPFFYKGCLSLKRLLQQDSLFVSGLLLNYCVSTLNRFLYDGVVKEMSRTPS